MITGLTNGTAYSVEIRAVNGEGNGTASTAVSGTPRAVPSAVADLAATAGNGEVVLTWTAPAANGSAITDYVIEFSSTGGSSWRPLPTRWRRRPARR